MAINKAKVRTVVFDKKGVSIVEDSVIVLNGSEIVAMIEPSFFSSPADWLRERLVRVER